MRFSIVTCTYNSAQYVQNNIDSVKNQTFDDFEHIFIDGFSTDKTLEIIKKYQTEFPNKVKLFQFEPKGIGNAMNKGIEKSQGEYIIHLHSDDSFYDLEILENISKFILKNNYPDLIYGKANFFNPETGANRIIPHRKVYNKLRFWLLLLTNYIPHQSVFIKKGIFEKYGNFDEQYKNSMDYDLWLRLAKNHINSKFIDKIVCNFSIRKDSQSSIGKTNNENIIAYKKYIKNKIILKFLIFLYLLNQKRSF